MKTDTEKMEIVVKEHSEHIQNDLLCILDGLNTDVLDNVCDVIVDRTTLLAEKLKQFTEKGPESYLNYGIRQKANPADNPGL